jgi:hypothetical protein
MKQRLSTLLNDVGDEISKRQVVLLLTDRLDRFHPQDASLLPARLVSASLWDGRQHRCRSRQPPFLRTHIGGEHFTIFRTSPTKSRLNFRTLLRGNSSDDVLIDAALALLENRQLDPAVLTD